MRYISSLNKNFVFFFFQTDRNLSILESNQYLMQWILIKWINWFMIFPKEKEFWNSELKYKYWRMMMMKLFFFFFSFEKKNQKNYWLKCTIYFHYWNVALHMYIVLYYSLHWYLERAYRRELSSLNSFENKNIYCTIFPNFLFLNDWDSYMIRIPKDSASCLRRGPL